MTVVNEDSCTSAVTELWKCQRAYNQQQEKYNKLLAFVKELNQGAVGYLKISIDKILREIGESND